MEALRKAEEAKRKGQDDKTTQADSPRAKTEQGGPAPAQPAFTLEAREETVHAAPDSFTEHDQPGAGAPLSQDNELKQQEEYPEQVPDARDTGPTDLASYVARQRNEESFFAARQSSDQQAAGAVFAAKRKQVRKRPVLKALVATVVVIVLAGGGTLFYLSDYTSSGISVNPSIANYDVGSRPPLSDQPIQTNAPAATAEAGTVAADVPEALMESLPVLEGPLPAQTGQDIADAEQETTAGEAETAQTAPAAETAEPAQAPSETAQAAAAASQEASTGNELLLSRGDFNSRPNVNATVQSAYNTFQAGDFAAAAGLYQQALDAAPNNRDALLGLAAIHTRLGNGTPARELYVRALQLNPRDPYARTGLLQNVGNESSPGFENELKALLNAYPELPVLHFALGSYYARGGRWSEAQGAYFNALLHARRQNDGPVSPDYAFNLAVSLEQLQQPDEALNYYRQAQELSRNSPPGFDMNLLLGRLAHLEQTQR